MGKVCDRTSYETPGVGGGREGLLQGRRVSTTSSTTSRLQRRRDQDVRKSLPPEKRSGAYQTFEGTGRACDVSSACHWTVNMAASNGHGRLWGEAYSVTPGGIYVPTRFGRPHGRKTSRVVPIHRRVPVGESLLDHPGARALHPARRYQAALRWDAVSTARALPRWGGPCGESLRRTALFRRAARVSENHRHDVHDRGDDLGRRRRRRRPEVLPGPEASSSRHRPQAEKYTHYYKNEFPERFREQYGHPDGSAPASGSCSSPTPKRCSTRPTEMGRRVEDLRRDQGGPRGSYEESVAAPRAEPDRTWRTISFGLATSHGPCCCRHLRSKWDASRRGRPARTRRIRFAAAPTASTS